MKNQVIPVLAGCVMVLLAACRTPQLQSSMEVTTGRVERLLENKTDSVSLHTADTVFVLVERDDSTTRITVEQIHYRERIKVVRDTVVADIRTDSIRNDVAVVEQSDRSPPSSGFSTVAILSLTAAIIAVIVLTIKLKKGNELWVLM